MSTLWTCRLCGHTAEGQPTKSSPPPDDNAGKRFRYAIDTLTQRAFEIEHIWLPLAEGGFPNAARSLSNGIGNPERLREHVAELRSAITILSANEEIDEDATPPPTAD